MIPARTRSIVLDILTSRTPGDWNASPTHCSRHSAERSPAACASGQWRPGFNVVQITHDEYQVHDMATRLEREGIAWLDSFPQGTERLIADGQMHKLAMKTSLAHSGDPDLREHIANAKAKLQTEEESHMRIVKRAPADKVDLAVAASMAVKRALDLNIE